ncbi:MAG: hypothetical protein ACE5JO_05360, partial [Candidatus Binatia bacterium]
RSEQVGCKVLPLSVFESWISAFLEIEDSMVCDGQLPNTFVLHWTAETMDEIFSRAGGTTFAEISKKNFRPIPILVPDQAVLAEWRQFVEPMYERGPAT